jgi:hypothetical protein
MANWRKHQRHDKASQWKGRADHSEGHRPQGHAESMNRHVTPKSLYLTQLKQRLGDKAVKNVINESQIINY